jgi:hypothetical protein
MIIFKLFNYSLHPEPILPQLFGVCFTYFRAVLSPNVLELLMKVIVVF